MDRAAPSSDGGLSAAGPDGEIVQSDHVTAVVPRRAADTATVSVARAAVVASGVGCGQREAQRFCGSVTGAGETVVCFA